jgi:hypothetical protein
LLTLLLHIFMGFYHVAPLSDPYFLRSYSRDHSTTSRPLSMMFFCATVSGIPVPTGDSKKMAGWSKKQTEKRGDRVNYNGLQFPIMTILLSFEVVKSL